MRVDDRQSGISFVQYSKQHRRIFKPNGEKCNARFSAQIFLRNPVMFSGERENFSLTVSLYISPFYGTVGGLEEKQLSGVHPARGSQLGDHC